MACESTNVYLGRLVSCSLLSSFFATEIVALFASYMAGMLGFEPRSSTVAGTLQG